MEIYYYIFYIFLNTVRTFQPGFIDECKLFKGTTLCHTVLLLCPFSISKVNDDPSLMEKTKKNHSFIIFPQKFCSLQHIFIQEEIKITARPLVYPVKHIVIKGRIWSVGRKIGYCFHGQKLTLEAEAGNNVSPKLIKLQLLSQKNKK